MKTKAIALPVEEFPGVYQRFKRSIAKVVSLFPDLTMATPEALNQETQASERRLVVGGKIITINNKLNRDS
ncbi:hypothetical protein [Rubellicoccus peritrichatus]|uniref:Uncharacterized protein n=1 Tax=Rubellicoccus peritrichatus TaxID=3080537 RepID=A0AAQ3L9I8_9BACT|nr:hypothetical protein [Puniceicoccus sp. CR14]WOO39805.1 hypothetical protein RZN69_14365 [Puniceicoccus sp. CR14]